MERLSSRNPEIRKLQDAKDCVVCGKPPQYVLDSVGRIDDAGWLPCCEDCYLSEKLENWRKEHNHSFDE